MPTLVNRGVECLFKDIKENIQSGTRLALLKYWVDFYITDLNKMGVNNNSAPS